MLNKPNAQCAGRRKDVEKKKQTFKAFKNLPYMQPFQKKNKTKKKMSYKPFASSILTRFVVFFDSDWSFSGNGGGGDCRKFTSES